MTAVTDRNQRISALVQHCFEQAETGRARSEDAKTKRLLDSVFGTTVWGYREILLVIVVAKILDEHYQPSRHFYQCNPRPLFEGPIREVLLARGIPHRKSGPLNVAKATIGINDQWAVQRRPADVAKNVVILVRQIEGYNSNHLEEFAVQLHARFLAEAKRVIELTVDTSPRADPAYIYNLATQLIREVPDAGNTPQKIFGLLLEAYHEDVQSGIKVTGHNDRASVTCTTSKKPGDVNEEQLDGTILKVYEITVKSFGHQRIIESYDTVKVYDEQADTKTTEITVVCRPEDVPADIVNEAAGGYYLGKVEHQDITYHFVSLEAWIMAQVLHMTADARLAFYTELAKYIAEPNTAEFVKLKWREIHANDEA